MKGTIRLALSSYIAVVVGCAPALALQEPGIAPARLASLTSTSVERPTRSSLNRASLAGAGGTAVRLPHASAVLADSLAVTVLGPTEVRSPSVASFRAAVTSRSTGSRFYYWWFSANCARRLGCSPSSYVLVAEGPGRDSVTLPLSATSAEKNLVVQVAELDGLGRTGSSPMFVVMGPAQNVAPATSTSATAKTSCDWFAGSFYPHTGDYTDPYSGRTWARHFRRDYCGNRVQWDPEG